jgi:hypothetical protein
MNSSIQFKTTTLSFLIMSALGCFAPLPMAQATDLGSVVPPQGNANTADGAGVLLNLTTGINNSGFGYFALGNDTTGQGNTAIGRTALLHNINGFFNTATGFDALRANTSGFWNTATGYRALYKNNGVANTANGLQALLNNTTGTGNTATGFGALLNNTGSNNIAIGNSAGSNLTTGDNNIDIGAAGKAGDIDTIKIGTAGTHFAVFIAGIRGVKTLNANAVPVVIDSGGQLGTMSSSVRFKKEIKPMDQTSEGILALKPVTFQYKGDATDTPQFGLIAEDVAKVNPDLVVRDGKGEIYTVRYEAVNAMLLNEFLKEHQTVQNQQKEIDALKAELKEQRAFIQKVNDKLELTKPTPQTVANNQ